MSQYSETMGSFSRTGSYPLEANYIFTTLADLRDFYSKPINATTLHKGLLKIVENDGAGKQALYWVQNINGNLEFSKLVTGDIISQLDTLSKKIAKEISDRSNMDKAIYGVNDPILLPSDRNSLKALSDAIDKLKLDSISTLTTTKDDVINLEVSKTSTGYSISGSLDISQETGNQLTKKSDGTYIKIHTLYEGGILTLFANDRLVSQHALGFSSIVSSATYDSANKQIVIVFKLSTGESQTVTIPVDAMIKEWDTDNTSTTKVVELTKDTTGTTDKLSGDIRIWNNTKNILKKFGNTIGVDGSSTNIKHGDKILKDVLDTLQEEINNISTGLYINEVE